MEYEIIESDSPIVRERYPDCRRVRNITTGQESQLFDNEAEAREVIRLATEGKLLGSFV